MPHWIITGRSAGMILTVVGVAGDISGVVGIRPNSAGKAGNRRIDGRALKYVDFRSSCGFRSGYRNI